MAGGYLRLGQRLDVILDAAKNGVVVFVDVKYIHRFQKNVSFLWGKIYPSWNTAS